MVLQYHQSMATKPIQAFECACEDCGYLWKALDLPDRCASCKSRSWNKSERQTPTTITKTRRTATGKDRLKSESAAVARMLREPTDQQPMPEPIYTLTLEAHATPCPRCDQPLIPWGTSKRCLACQRNF